MELSITAQHFDVTPAIEQYVRDKLKRIEKHVQSVQNSSIVLHIEKSRCHADATFHFPGNSVHANAVANDMYEAIDSMVLKLDKQIVRIKEKKNEKHKHRVPPQ